MKTYIILLSDFFEEDFNCFTYNEKHINLKDKNIITINYLISIYFELLFVDFTKNTFGQFIYFYLTIRFSV